jgi:hypothetical protein
MLVRGNVRRTIIDTAPRRRHSSGSSRIAAGIPAVARIRTTAWSSEETSAIALPPSADAPF